MSDSSPLFISSAELLIHSVELFRQVDERKYKFIILHLANAVELILQDRLIDAGKLSRGMLNTLEGHLKDFRLRQSKINE